jgi:hypothetical protein
MCEKERIKNSPPLLCRTSKIKAFCGKDDAQNYIKAHAIRMGESMLNYFIGPVIFMKSVKM